MQEHIGKVSREMETLRTYEKETPKIRSTVTKMQNAFDGLIGRLNMAGERICEFKNMSIETSKTEMQR